MGLQWDESEGHKGRGYSALIMARDKVRKMHASTCPRTMHLSLALVKANMRLAFAKAILPGSSIVLAPDLVTVIGLADKALTEAVSVTAR